MVQSTIWNIFPELRLFVRMFSKPLSEENFCKRNPNEENIPYWQCFKSDNYFIIRVEIFFMTSIKTKVFIYFFFYVAFFNESLGKWFEFKTKKDDSKNLVNFKDFSNIWYTVTFVHFYNVFALKSNFLLCRLFFKYNFVSKEENLISFLWQKDIAEWNKIFMKKIKKWRRTVRLFCDIKSLFWKSVGKKLKIYTSIFHPVLLQFYDSSYHFSYSTQHNLSITKINK